MVPGRERRVLAQLSPDLGHRAAQVAALEPRRDGHVLPQVLAAQSRAGPAPRLTSATCAELHHGAVGRADRQLAQRGDPVDARRVDQHADVHHAVALEHGRRGLARAWRCSTAVGRCRRRSGRSAARRPVRTRRLHRRAGVHQAVEGVHHARDLLDAAPRPRGAFFFRNAGVGREDLDLDRLGRPHQVADQVARGCPGTPSSTPGSAALNSSPQLGDHLLGRALAVGLAA